MSTVRALILASPDRLDDVQAMACALDSRFASISVRPFALTGGASACPPGLAFVAALDACPDAFIDLAFLDPEIGRRQQELIARCLAPKAEVHGGDIEPSLPPCDLDAWLPRRGAYVAGLLARASSSEPWQHSAALLDDLVLEAIDAQADRLFGQRRRRTLDVPGFALPSGTAWSNLPPPPAPNDAHALPNATTLWRRLFPRAKPAGAPPLDAASASALAVLAGTLAEGATLGQEIDVGLPADRSGVAVNVEGGDAAVLAMGLACAPASREMAIRVVDSSSARLGAFVVLYRELRFLVGGRVSYRWCPAPEPPPPADVTLTRTGKTWASTSAQRNDTSPPSAPIS